MKSNVKTFRKEGRFEEAYELAVNNHRERPDVWTKRDLAWVLYDYIKIAIDSADSEQFFVRLEELSNLRLPKDESMFADAIVWCYSKWIRNNYNNHSMQQVAIVDINRLLDLARYIPLNRPTDGYSALISAIHKTLKGGIGYVEIISRLGFDYFQERDFAPFITPDGQKILSLVEQMYNQYSKSLLSKIEIEKNNSGLICDETIKHVDNFIDKLSCIINSHSDYIYPLYYKSKLLLSLGRNEVVTSLLTPFVKRKSKDFWVWQILGDASKDNRSLALSCYCKGLLCKSQEEMLVGLREAIAYLMIENGDYSEAKFEIQKCINTRMTKWGRITSSLDHIINQEWFITTESSKNNISYYNKHINEAEMIVWGDDVRSILITYVKQDNYIANYITLDDKSGYFRFDKLQKMKPKVGEVYNVVMDNPENGKPSKVSFFKLNVNSLQTKFYKRIRGKVSRKEGAKSAFIGNTYISSEVVSKYNLQNLDEITATAVKSYNKKKGLFTWNVMSVLFN